MRERTPVDEPSQFNAKKARAKRPCPIWVDAFQRDTQHLSTDEVGAYFLILMAMWSREDCDLPNDPERLARVSRTSPILWKRRIGPAIMAFLTVQDGSVISKRLREEATFVEHHVEQQSNRKKGKSKDKPLKTNKPHSSTDMSTDKPRDHPTQQPNNPTYNNSDDKSSSLLLNDDDFEEFAKAHPRFRDTPECERAWQDAIKAGVDTATIIAGTKRYAEDAKAYDADKVKFSDNWLASEGWKKYPQAPPEEKITEHEILTNWADNIKAGRGFGLQRQMADQLVQAGMITKDQLSQAKGYNG